MAHFNSLDEILDFAVSLEEDAHKFFKYLSNRVGSSALQAIMDSFAGEELEHKRRIESFRSGKQIWSLEKFDLLEIPDYAVLPQPSPYLDYNDLLKVAIKKEAASCRVYTYLAKTADNESFKEVFLLLAKEEARHKKWFEQEYTDKIALRKKD